MSAAIHYAYSANYDRKDVPVVGNPNADMAAVSADGKTLTITTAGKDATGQNVDSVAVYEKA